MSLHTHHGFPSTYQPKRRQANRRCVTFLLALTLMACAGDPVIVKYAPGLQRAGRHISVFGIRRDGLMSPSGWAALGPYASAPFSEEPCDVAYSEATSAAVPALASAIEAYVRENGVTDELLDQIAPAAKGDMIMLLTVAGHPLAAVEDPTGASYQRSLPPSMGSGSHRGNARSQAKNRTNEASSNADALELSASFFSIRDHRAVGLATMRYSGANTDQALTQFTTRLEHEFPGSTCSGWDWSVPIDDTKIGKLGER
jgi:hypothetical protein